MTKSTERHEKELVRRSCLLREFAEDALKELPAMGGERAKLLLQLSADLEELYAAVAETRGASGQTVAARVQFLDASAEAEGKGAAAAGTRKLSDASAKAKGKGPRRRRRQPAGTGNWNRVYTNVFFPDGREAFYALCSSLTKAAGVEFVERRVGSVDRLNGLLWVLCQGGLGRAVQAKKDLFDSLLTRTERARALWSECVVAVEETCTDAAVEEVVGKIVSFLVDEAAALRKEKAALDRERGALGAFAKAALADGGIEAEMTGAAEESKEERKRRKGAERQRRSRAKKKREGKSPCA